MAPVTELTKVKKGCGRQKVLSTKKRLTANTKATYSINETESKLLALPAEIRNRIWRCVLGDAEIHMDYWHEESSKAIICRAAHSYRETAKQAIKSSVSTLCVTSQGVPTSHSEASIIPFATNTFKFVSFSRLIEFANHLLPEQRIAITSITLALRESTLRAQNSLPKSKDIVKLNGLRHITLLVNATTIASSHDRMMEQLPKRLSATVELLKYIDWETAVVCVTADVRIHGGFRMFTAKQIRDLRAQCRESELTLLQSWDAAEEVRRRKEESMRKRDDQRRRVKAIRDMRNEVEKHQEAERDALRMKRGLRSV